MYQTAQRRTYHCIYGIVCIIILSHPLPCFETAASSINNIVMNETQQHTVRKYVINLKTRSPFIGKTQRTKRTIAEKYVHCVRSLSSY
jgi:hypothetical protein